MATATIPTTVTAATTFPMRRPVSERTHIPAAYPTAKGSSAWTVSIHTTIKANPA